MLLKFLLQFVFIELSSKKQNFGIEEPIKSPPLFDNGTK